MTEKSTGGQAFPKAGYDGPDRSEFSEDGMTLRDYFAAKALVGGIAEFFQGGHAWADYNEFAESCYGMADAMLKERAK